MLMHGSSIRLSALLCVLACGAHAGSQGASTTPERHFRFVYQFSVRNVPPGQRLRVWFPQARSNAFQTVTVETIETDLPVRTTKEAAYQNLSYYAETPAAAQSTYQFEVVYDVTRKEERAHASERSGSAGAVSGHDLAADELVPTTGLPARLAAAQVAGKTTVDTKARALYDYTLANMRYDKSGTGWGHGDTLYACRAKQGNCTDFHSLFISMARSQRIPARFEIGFPLPGAAQSGEVAGYHCWAEFYDPRQGWVPVDISEAWKDPARRDYFFGALDTNRLLFTTGRDLVLSPRQEGKALNYFVYPYVEVAGKPWDNVADAFSFREAGADAKRQGTHAR